jgi:hypothetical protein
MRAVFLQHLRVARVLYITKCLYWISSTKYNVSVWFAEILGGGSGHPTLAQKSLQRKQALAH